MDNAQNSVKEVGLSSVVVRMAEQGAKGSSVGEVGGLLTPGLLAAMEMTRVGGPWTAVAVEMCTE